MTTFRYTPYDGSAVPFTMGLKPLDPAQWIEPDEHLAQQLELKDHYLTNQPNDVFQARPDALEAQQETLSLLLDYLPEHHPSLYKSHSGNISVLPINRTFNCDAYSAAPLALAGRLVQDDLCIIQPSPEGHVLTAASLCFPSSWALRDKIGKPMERVHAPVPGYQEYLAQKVNFMMERLTADRIIWRQNWSLDEGPDLHRPSPHAHDSWLESDADPEDHIFIRVERQTLRRLPESGAILFTIRIYTDALKNLKNRHNAAQLARGLVGQLENLSPDELAYKGLSKAAHSITNTLIKYCQ